MGGEVVVDYVVELKMLCWGKVIWVVGYCNDVMVYILFCCVWFEGGYEGEGVMVYYGFFS